MEVKAQVSFIDISEASSVVVVRYSIGSGDSRRIVDGVRNDSQGEERMLSFFVSRRDADVALRAERSAR
jgi:hypothetical protein